MIVVSRRCSPIATMRRSAAVPSAILGHDLFEFGIVFSGGFQPDVQLPVSW
jgi:hypothetical protein